MEDINALQVKISPKCLPASLLQKWTAVRKWSESSVKLAIVTVVTDNKEHTRACVCELVREYVKIKLYILDIKETPKCFHGITTIRQSD